MKINTARATDVITGVVGTLAAGALIAGAMLVAQPSQAEQTANDYGITVVWMDELTCAGIEAWGCFDTRDPNQIEVVRGLHPDDQEYVILHELGHAVYYRFGEQSTECQADAFAISMGAGSFRDDC